MLGDIVWEAISWSFPSYLRCRNKSNCSPVFLVSGTKLCCSTKMKNGFRNWSDIRVFLSVFREGSTLAASRKLKVSQPTVARRIDVLERETGLTLFERGTHGFKPTPEAFRLVPLAEAIENSVLEFADCAKELTSTQPIRITAYSANFSARMIEIVNEFSADNQDVAFEFLSSVRALDLMAGEADIALRLARTDPDPDLICRKISTARWSLFGCRNYADKFGLPGSTNDLAGHQFVTFQRDDVPNVFHEWLTNHAEPDQIVMSFTELELMHAAIRSGQGLGISNVKLVETDMSFIRCFDEIPELAVPHLMLISPEAYRRPEVRAFVKFFAPRYAAIYK
ncbi:LysR family transcriptional regulator [Ruegeria atlantica]|uniref:LysR family transcriptional regulator n=1 Tax=Ruegeria atlantica TaxID=81569 RepID=UPI0032B462C5